MTYSIAEHTHRFAAWAAGRAASVSGCRFTARKAQKILEAAGLNRVLAEAQRLPSPGRVDAVHRGWRRKVIAAAAAEGRRFTHGVAAKLINVYMKAGFVCGGRHQHRHVRALHPPIDSVLLDELARNNFGGLRAKWNAAKKARWSKFKSNQYEALIRHIRRALKGSALWKIEEHWRGYQ